MKSAGLAPIFFLAFSFSPAADLAPSTAAEAVPEKSANPDPASNNPPATSASTTARVVDALPKFVPHAAASSGNSADSSLDRRTVDKPRNTIIRLPPSLLPSTPSPVESSASLTFSEPPSDGVIRLPKYEVRDRKAPALKNRELLTPEAKIELEFKHHPGLHIGNLFGLNRGIASAMAAEDDAYERKLEFEDLLDFQKFISTLPPPKSDADSAETAPIPTPASARAK
jgi:hypothetical protein